jgi:hypothetical protein
VVGHVHTDAGVGGVGVVLGTGTGLAATGLAATGLEIAWFIVAI